MKSLSSRMLVILLCLNLQACATSIYNWSEVTNQDYLSGYSENEKVEYYKRHAIKEYKPYFGSSQGKGFITYAAPDKIYTFNSYAPFVYQIAPDAQKYYQESRFWSNTSNEILKDSMIVSMIAFWWITEHKADQRIAAAQGTMTQSEVQNNALIALSSLLLIDLAAIGISNYLDYKSNEQYDKIKSTYNEALRKELGLTPEQVSQIQ